MYELNVENLAMRQFFKDNWKYWIPIL